MKEKEFLGKDKISSLLIKLSTPAVIGMVVNALYNLVDTIFVGNSEGTLALGALAIAFPIQMTINAIALGIGIGASSIVSRALGSQDLERGKKAIGNTYVLIVVINILVAIFGLNYIDQLLNIFGATKTIAPYAREYLSVILLFNVLYGVVVAINNLVRAEGNPKVAMTAMVIGMITNIILDPIFIFDWGLDLGVRGAALATATGQAFSFIYIIYFFITSNTFLRVKPKHLKLDFNVVEEIFKIGFPTFIRNFAGSFIAMLVNNLIRKHGGDLGLSVYGTVNKLMMFFFMPAFGIVQGLQPIIGYNFGAKKYGRVIEAVKITSKWLAIYMGIMWAIIMLFPGQALYLFTQEPEFIALGTKVIRIILLAVPVVSIQIVASTLFQGIGKAKQAAVVSLSRQILFLVPMILILSSLFGLEGIFAAYPTADILAVGVSVVLLRTEVKRLKQMEKENDSV